MIEGLKLQARQYLLGSGSRSDAERALVSIVVIMLFLVGIGLVASSSFAFPGLELQAARLQAMYIAVGLAAFLVGCRLPLERFKGHSGSIVLVTVALLSAVFLFPPINHARRWILLGSFSFQPSELAKVALVIYIAAFVSDPRTELSSFTRGFLAPLLRVGLISMLVLLEPDFGTAVFLFVVAAVMLVVAGARMAHFLISAAFALPILLMVAWIKFDHIAARIEMWFRDDVYQMVQGRIAMASGGVFGQGIGRGVMKLGLVPEGRNDLVFAQIGEEWGLVGTAMVVLLFALFVVFGMRLLMGIRDRYLALISFGCLFIIAFQAVMNLAVVTRLAPPKGIALPFVSAGGSSLTVFMLAVGCVVNATRKSLAATAISNEPYEPAATGGSVLDSPGE